ncbi:hypothetical protein [Carboxylicivirga taeanensis]|uniref:hypothetical protein n=1 Tax=Carboxylicivirga taeanensis TaxID=1416875 RepID=UPI003F6DF9CB
MKKLLLLLFCCAFLRTEAQTTELSLTYSPLSLYQLEKLVDGSFEGQSKYFVLGAFNMEYSSYLNNWLKLGINLMYDKTVSEGSIPFYYSPLSVKNPEYRSTKSAFIIAPVLDFEYLRHPKFKLSSGLSIGYGYERIRNEGGLNQSMNINGLTFQINLLGFRWGQQQGLTGNIGFGYKGAINLGYFIRF